MSSQASLSPRVQAPASAPALDAWVGLLRAHAAVTRELSSGLLADHGLTINDYEALLHLAHAPGGMRRVDLAERLLLTASGVTRLLEGLETAGLVAKRACEVDARVTYAVLTDAGARRFEEARASHARAIRELFESRLDEQELRALAALLDRLPAAGACPGDGSGT
jgi:DNA-binding MarR family transcriptional regulator